MLASFRRLLAQADLGLIDGWWSMALWIMRTEAPWRDLPEEFGKWGTVYDLFTTWNQDGTLDETLDLLRSAHVDAGAIDRELWCVDGTTVRAARCAAGAVKGGG